MSFTLSVVYDREPCNPRTDSDCNLTQMICAHRRYNLGDKPYRNQAYTRQQIGQEFGPVFLVEPLYLYDHSGITISTSPFSCPWDSGQVGWVLITKETVRREYQRSKQFPSQMKWARAQLESEVKVYDQYLRGDVWQFSIEEDATGNIVESCSGFYGEDDAKQEGQSTLEYVLANPEKYATRKAA